MKFLLVCFFFFNALFAQEGFQTQEQSLFEATTQEENSSLLPSSYTNELNPNENDETIEESQLSQEISTEPEEENYAYLFEEVPFDVENKQSNTLYAKFTSYPNTVYTSQRFALEIETLVTTTEFTKIETRFLNSQEISIINPEEVWTKSSNNSYKNLYFFKVYSQAFKMPTFQIVLYNEDEVVDVIYLEPKELNYTNIALKDNQFSNVIAKEVKVLSSKTRQYSNNELLTVLEIEATQGNLEDFRLKEFEDQLLMSLEESYPKQKLIYNTIIPIHTKEIRFNYYDTQSNQFKKIIVPIKLEEELVSTQTDLNPNDSNLEVYKKVALGVLTILFIVMYLIKRKNSYIVIAVVLSILFFMYAKPNSAMVIEEETKIYILPTNNSTVFYITPNKQLVEILDKKEHFIKILFKLNDHNGKTVGWIKEEDIVED
ncbi:MAG: hypothetical protein RBT24_00165 [Arcobacteraceae bacterium]|jgi:hypothetical protein|nr:hypothetical protein [Arcobacteraceae bacterium]